MSEHAPPSRRAKLIALSLGAQAHRQECLCHETHPTPVTPIERAESSVRCAELKVLFDGDAETLLKCDLIQIHSIAHKLLFSVDRCCAKSLAKKNR